MGEYRALYRETRPEVFSEILGQDHIVKILKHQIATHTVSHAYLFCGTRGTGKTTTARILAKAVNCTAEEGNRPCGECESCKAIAAGTFLDVIEIDAASNNGVENIRELRESVKYPPSVGRKKVYIIDEVHMLSTGAFNALLKTLEEPPEHVMFILATTNPEKLPQTILSRCLRLDFKRVPSEILAAHMAEIAKAKNVEVTEDALRLLTGNADGSVRDSLSILEQCLSSGEPVLTREIVLDFLGTAPMEFFLSLTEKVMTRNISDAFLLLDDALREGKDVRQLMKDWMGHCRNLLIAKYLQDPGDMLNLSSENIELLQKQSQRVGITELNHAIVTLAKSINDARYSTQARILMEVAIVTIASGMDYGKSAVRTERRMPEPKQAPVRPAAVQPQPVPVANSGMQTGALAPMESPQPIAPEMQGLPMQPTRAPQEALQSRQVAEQAPQEMPASNPQPRQAAAQPENPDQQAGEEAPPTGRTLTLEELEEIWRMAFEALEADNPKLNAMRFAKLADVSERQFKVIVGSPTVEKVLTSEKDVINREISAQLGREVVMVCRVESERGKSKEEMLEQDAQKASELLGVDVKLV